MKTKRSIIEYLVDKILGHKYYACVVGMQGSGKYFLQSDIFRSRQELDRYKESLLANRSFIFIESHSWRSRNDFMLERKLNNKHQDNIS